MMRPDQDRVNALLKETVTLLCKNGLQFRKKLRIEGLLAITVDDGDIFIVRMDEKILPDQIQTTINMASSITTGSFSTGEITHRTQTSTVCAGNIPACVRDADRQEAVGTTATIPVCVRDFEMDLESVEKEDKLKALPPVNINSELCNVKQEIVEADHDHIDLCAVPYSKSNSPSSVNMTSRNYKLHVGRKRRRYNEGLCESDSENRFNFTLAEEDSCSPSEIDDFLVEPSGSNWSFNQRLAEIGQDQIHFSLKSQAPSARQERFSDLGSGGYEQRLPLNTVASKAVRDILLQDIVEPFVHKSLRSISAFRLVWRGRNTSEINDLWREIHQRRVQCDNVVRRQPNVDFFFSSVTGLYNKSMWRDPSAAIDVSPAVSYYIVGDINNGKLCTDLRGTIGKAQMRPITVRLTNTEEDSASVLAAPLYLVLKDYNSGYVRRKLNECQHASIDCKMEQGDSWSDTDLPVSKLVVVNQDLQGDLSRAYDLLRVACQSFSFQLDVV